MEVFSQVITLFLLMLCGLAATKFRLIDHKGQAGLNSIVLNFAQPCLILSSLQRDASPQLMQDLLWTFLLSFVLITLSGVFAFRIFIREEYQRRAVLTNLSIMSNCGFMGYPVISAALGEEALIYAVVYLAAFQILNWTLGIYYYAGVKALRPQALLRNPSLWAAAAGLVLFLTGWRLPKVINTGVDMFAAVTTPLAMFIIGARLTGVKIKHLADKSLLLSCLIRLIGVPLLVLPLRLTSLSPEVVSVLFLSSAMPGAALTSMIADLYHSDADLASRGVALSTAMSIVTIPLMLLLI